MSIINVKYFQIMTKTISGYLFVMTSGVV